MNLLSSNELHCFEQKDSQRILVQCLLFNLCTLHLIYILLIQQLQIAYKYLAIKNLFWTILKMPYKSYSTIDQAMSEKKSLRGTLSTKSKDTNTEQLFIPDEYLLVIFHAQFYRNLLLLCTKNFVLIYDLKVKAIVKEHKVFAHIAAFIPNTPYIAYVIANEQGKPNTLMIWNYEANTIDSTLTFAFQIETLKASRHCLIFSSLLNLYVLHFPSLKPIFNGSAGNGFSIVYDISKEGLTIVHSTEIKGDVCIRNFTNEQTNRYINAIRTTSNQISERIKKRSTRRLDQSFIDTEEEQIKTEIHVKAHHENVAILRLSPNGYRFVSGSTKGTVLRLYSCLNGQIMAQFHLCNALSAIVDINFIPEGNAIVCLNDENHVKLFHTKMSEEQVICQSVRRGREIYEQENPKSWLSFLGFLKEDLAYQQPFSHFNLESLSSKDPARDARTKSTQRIVMSEIKEQSHESQLIAAEEVEHQQSESLSPAREVYVEQMNMAEIINNSQKTNSMRHSNSISQTEEKNAKTKNNRGSHAIHKKKSGSTSLKSLVRKQAEVVVMNRERKMNFKGIIMFENHIDVKIFKGKYYYELKYDPFNGGEMMSKQPKLNLFQTCLGKYA